MVSKKNRTKIMTKK